MIATRRMRLDILAMAKAANIRGAHLGGSLSLVEIIAALYDGVMHFDPKVMDDPARDRLILSKGHGVMAQYAALKQLGLYSHEELFTYKSDASVVAAHPSRDLKRGIEFSSGSLGQGLSLGAGVALALKKRGNLTSRVFVILGDGECDEGQVWEAAMAASHFKLNNLIAIIDRNALQYDGPTEEVLALGNLKDKWLSFGWDSSECDGHDVNELKAVLSKPHSFPHAVIANTIKGKGISFMENAPAWHNGVLTEKLYAQAVEELS